MGAGRRIVIVEDNRDMVAATEALFRAHGHQTSSCYNGTDALSSVRAFDPDVVLLDKNLPGRHGWDVAQDIRKVYPGKRPLLIGITAEVSQASGVLSEVNGLDYCVSKLVDLKVLLDLIDKAEPGQSG